MFLRLLLLVLLLLGLRSVGRGAPVQEPLLPFKVVSVFKTNCSIGKPAVGVVVRGPAGMTNDVLSAVLVNKNGVILCETLGGTWTGGNPAVLLCVESLKNGDYELWLKLNPYQPDSVWPNNEADQLGQIIRLRVGDRWIAIVEQTQAPAVVPKKKTPAWVKARYAKQKLPVPPVLPGN